MGSWRILDAEGLVVSPCVTQESEPDPAAYGGATAEPLDGPVDPASLSQITTALLAKIDREAGEFRQRFITSIPGQEATYLEKESQARAWIAAEDPDEDEPAFGMLKAEAVACGLTVAAVATAAATQATAWRALNYHIEGRRLGAKTAVKAAATKEAKLAAAMVDWEALLP